MVLSEFHGYIYDFKERNLDLNKITKHIGGYKKIGEWDKGVSIVGWNMTNHSNMIFALSKYDLFIQSFSEMDRHILPKKIVWNGDPPSDTCIII
jgi:hypothetical protein